MAWFSPLDRREISLVLFCITVFTLAYNLETSFRYLGVDPVNTQAVLGHFGLGRFNAIENDGRKLAVYRDKLESKIYGTWAWTSGYIAGDGAERSQGLGGPYGSMWLGQDQVGELRSKTLGQDRISDGFRRWGHNVPLTTLVKHVPGYTILDNVIAMNGSVYVITDKLDSFPPLDTISSQNVSLNEWRLVSSKQALEKIGPYGGVVPGVTWLSPDSNPHNATLLSLWRTYSSLDPAIDASGNTVLSLPRRLIFPNIRFFTDSNPDFDKHWIRRRRVDTGFHPFLAKAAFPYMTEMYFEDWEDYHQMEVPFLFERLVVADRSSASRTIQPHQPVFSPAFDISTSPFWWEPIRQTLNVYFGGHDAVNNKVVTYIHRQEQPRGPKMASNDHTELVRALHELQRKRGYEVNIVSSLDEETSWDDRMKAVVRSTVVLGVHSDDLFDVAYSKPSPQTTLMEFFPSDSFVRDRQLVAQSLRLKYIAWWPDRIFYSDELPTVAQPTEQDVSVDISAVISTIEDILSH